MKKLIISMMIICLCASTTLFAADGDWTSTVSGGNYSDTANWDGATVADGVGATMYYTNTVPNAFSVNVDDSRTLGTIISANSGDWRGLATSTGVLTLDNGVSSPIINVNNMWAMLFTTPLAGVNGFTKTGTAGMGFWGPTTISGNVILNDGWMGVYNDQGYQNADVVLNAGILRIGNGINVYAKSITTSGGKIMPDGIAGNVANINAPLSLGNGEWATVIDSDALDNITININSNSVLRDNAYLNIGGNGSIFNINAPISGPYLVRFLQHSGIVGDVATVKINSPCTYTGNTMCYNWRASGIYELGVNQALPGENELYFDLNEDNATSYLMFELNSYTQVIKNLSFQPGASAAHANKYIEVTGNSDGLLIVTNQLWSVDNSNGRHIKLTGGKLVCDAPGCSLGTKMYISNATFLNNGSWWAGTAAEFIMLPGGKIGGSGFLGWEGGASTNLVIAAGATITPGTSIGTVGCWNLELKEGSLYDWEIGTGTADMVDVRGGLTLPASAVNSVTVNVSQLSGIPSGQTNWLAQTAEGVTGSADSVYMNYPPELTGPEHPEILWGHLMVTGIIPEPATLGLIAVLGLAFLRKK